MFATHGRALLLVAAGLATGLSATTAPAVADSKHDVTVAIASVVPGWAVSVQCTPADGGASVQRQSGTVSLGLVQAATFKHLPDATCTVQATQARLIAAGMPGSASVTGVSVARDLTVPLTPGVASCANCTPATGSTAPADSGTPVPAAPQVSGKPVVGQVLTADAAAAPAGATITGYQWYVRRHVHGHQRTVLVRIKHAHHRSLRMKERLAGKHVLVGVTYTLAGSTPSTVYSKALKVMKERMKE